MEAFQTGEELSAEYAAKNLHRQEERIARSYPAAVIRRQSARRNGAVNMRMEQQVLSPSVKNADDTDFRTQVFGIACHFQQRLCASGKQQVVKHSRVVQRQHIEFVRHSEYDMKIAGGEKLAFASCEPMLARLRLAFRTMPVAARVIGDGAVTALRTGIDVAAQRSRAAALNGAKRLELESQSSVDTDPGSGRPARGGCRPPPRWAGSFLSLAMIETIRRSGDRKMLKRIDRLLQMPARQVQVDARSLQVGVTE